MPARLNQTIGWRGELTALQNHRDKAPFQTHVGFTVETSADCERLVPAKNPNHRCQNQRLDGSVKR
jgi:hypothetical protein